MVNLRSSVYIRGLLFVVAVCVALITLDLRQSWTARHARLQEARTDTENLVGSLAQHAQDVFETTDAVLKGLIDAYMTDGRDPAAIRRLERRMQTRITSQQLLWELFLFDENGDWVASSRLMSALGAVRQLNYANRDFFRYHIDHADTAAAVGPPFQSKLDGAWVVTVSRRLNHPDGSFAGVVGASIRIDLFQRFFETFDIGKGGAITLASRAGLIIVRRPFDQNNIGRNITQGELFQKIRDDATAGTFEFNSLLDGRARLGSFHRIPGFNLIMMVALDRNEVLIGWRHETKVHLVWLSLAVFLVLGLGHRMILQIRDRVAAETIAQRLQLEADQRQNTEAERRSYEQQLEQQKYELERSNAALEQFAYAASHDLQSPLRAIGHLAQWIEEDVRATANAETMDNLRLMNGRVARMQTLITGLLAYARIGHTGLVADDVDVAAAVQEVVNLLDKRPDFVVACAGEMSTIRTYRAPFEMVLKNLISNALQHHDRAEGRVSVSMRLLDGMAEVRISDDGPGIEARFHDEIFVIFKTLQSRDETELGGIGLAMVKKQVIENGGRIWVESAPPVRGTAFVFTWKLAVP